ncbi:DUF262 domain-containing protein [Aliarcobacter cryaerophilus]|uniref:DUF262 domain-containing protein n=1 Tax=Aliarcobacter cryaerophilus TaxID=28198 RepID=UPI0021B5F361|nr:DUF262 domain-containing protein [Aliarcobacter cryaerophilus]MCT7472983.1 DUF262 domain-containing protein [Aliarcobacter cryaerophilus]
MSEVLENPKLKSIYELLCNEEKKAERFFIPSYQRGYRWTEQQVKDLLNDIWEFHQNVKLRKNDGFYCLQPIVVKKSKNENYDWDVIDGQQRLTTIFIILKSGEIFLTADDLEPYTIGYETRIKSQDFLESKLYEIDDTNIDYFHMSKAYQTIENWFKEKKVKKSDFIKVLLEEPLIDENVDKANNIRVIWYEIEDKENNSLNAENIYKEDIEIFTRINMGKIPLTNAELIKALLIQGYGINGNKNNKQFELASEWDFIEYSLQNDDFWYFINKDKNEKATRIEFIFELIAENYIKDKNDLSKSLNKSIDRYYEFHIINYYLQNDTRDEKEKKETIIYEKLWSEVKNYFRILNEWYEDKEFFHKIGFLAIYSEEIILNFIYSYIEKSKTKQDFRIFLDEQIKSVFKNKKEFIDIESLSYGVDDNNIRKVLLWFNISTIIKNEKSNLRFQFDRYKKQNWDIEHIRSQADKYPNKKEEKEAWIDDILKLPNIKKTKDIILKMEKKDFNEFFDDIQNKIEGEDNDFNKHSIGNLTLLGSATNRGYGNAFFPVKRKSIIENDMNGTFIPICTKNLFLKYYSLTATDLQKWTKEDAEDYKSAILETFVELKNGAKNEKQ